MTSTSAIAIAPARATPPLIGDARCARVWARANARRSREVDELVEPHHDAASGRRRPQREQDAGLVGRRRERLVADREHLAVAAEHDVLLRDDALHAQTVDRD